VPGQHVSENWGAYPLHPAPDVKLIQAKGQFRPIIASATRTGDTLDLYLTAFSDSVPGQTGGGVGFQFDPAAGLDLPLHPPGRAGV
jgi:hypothetical protein